MSETHQPPYYAVIFSSQRTNGDRARYDAMADRMVELASGQPGFVGIESVRDAAGRGITVSYWRDRESIRAWRDHAEHRMAQQNGRERWYAEFDLRVCLVEEARHFEAAHAAPPEKTGDSGPTTSG